VGTELKEKLNRKLKKCKKNYKRKLFSKKRDELKKRNEKAILQTVPTVAKLTPTMEDQ
jgi:hypothetical protein